MIKFIKSILSLALIISMFSFSGFNVFAAESVESPIQTKNIEGEFTFEYIISLEEYVSINEGLFNLDTTSAVKDGVSLKLLEGLQRHLDSLNSEINEGELEVNKNLEITNSDSNLNVNIPKPGISLLASCSGSGVTTKAVSYWWGVSRKLNSCDADKFAANLASVAAGVAPAALLGGWIPGIGWGSIISAAYAGLYSTRVYANNSYSTGVKINMTFVGAYDIEPQ